MAAGLRYASEETGTAEVYVRPFPPTSEKVRVSPAGGYQPDWRRDGGELYHVTPDRTLTSVTVRAADGRLEFGKPAPLFRAPIAAPSWGRNHYQPSADGQRFLINVLQPNELKDSPELVVVLDWAQSKVLRVKECHTTTGVRPMKTLLTLALLAAGAASASAQPNPPSVVRYEATIDNVKYLFGPATPVARVRPGQIVEANTLDAFGNVLRKPGDSLSMVKGLNPLTGPFYVEGAEPGDTLVVKVLELQLDADQGVGALGPGFGALNSTTYTPMLQAPLPERIWFYPVDKSTNTARFTAQDSAFSVAIPLHPFLGCLGVAPALGESRAVPTRRASGAATWTRPR